jgi:hypothetical protein
MVRTITATPMAQPITTRALDIPTTLLLRASEIRGARQDIIIVGYIPNYGQLRTRSSRHDVDEGHESYDTMASADFTLGSNGFFSVA